MMKQNEHYVSGTFLRDCIRKAKRINDMHLTGEKQLQMKHLQKVADKYFIQFQEGKLHLSFRDFETFADYINMFGLENKDMLLDKLQQRTHFDVREYLNKSEIPLWRERLSAYKQKTVDFWHKWQNKIKTGFVSTLVVIGGFSLFKSGVNSNSDAQEQKAQSSALQQTLTASQTDTLAVEQKKSPLIQPQTKDTSAQEAKALTNFYNYRLSRFLGVKKRDAMLKKMEQQVENKRIVLPNDISAAHYLYAAEIYQRYNFKSIAAEMMKVQNMTDVLPDSVQQKLFGYVRQAGVKGVGVQQMSLGKQTFSRQLSR